MPYHVTYLLCSRQIRHRRPETAATKAAPSHSLTTATRELAVMDKQQASAPYPQGCSSLHAAVAGSVTGSANEATLSITSSMGGSPFVLH